MKFRWIVLLGVGYCGIGLLSWHAASPAVAGPPSLVTAATGVMPWAMPDGEYSYVGNKACKKCHINQFKSWEKTRMGKAFEILKPGNSKEAKEKFKIEVDKDFTKDEKCLKCHTTGFGKPGGYAIPDPADKKAVRTAKKFEGVGCEMCHGPGSEYSKVFKEIQKSKRKYKVEELYAIGLQKVGEEVCLTCHNEESPTINKGDKFDYEKRKEEGTHEHKPLKQREE
jgi:cytochrome c5